MTRLIQIWLALFAANVVAALTIGILGFQVIDLRFEVFAQAILVPWTEAVVVWWFLAGHRSVSLAGSLKEVIRKQPALAMFLVADAILLVSSWQWTGSSPEDVSRDWRMATVYVGLKAAISGCLILTFAFVDKRASAKASVWTAALGTGLLVCASTCFFDWHEFLPDVLFPGLRLLFRWLAFYGSLFVASLWVLLKVQVIWQDRSPAAARILELVPALSLVAATVVVIGVFNNPNLAPVWDQVARSFAFLSVSALWLAVWHFRKET